MVSKNLERMKRFANLQGLYNVGLHGLRRLGTFSGKAFLGPVQMRINPISYRCNNQCDMCDLRNIGHEKLHELIRIEQEEKLALNDYKSLLSNLLPGLVSVNVTGGGEPLLHPDILDIMREIKRCRLTGSLITNGVLMDEKTSRQIINMGWDGIRVSVHAGDPETYKKICGTDHFEKIKDNIKTFNRITAVGNKKKKPRIVIFNVVQRHNIASIHQLFEFAEEVQADTIEFERLIPFLENLRLNTWELEEARERIIYCANASRVSCNVDSIVHQLHKEIITASGNNNFCPAKRCSVGYDQVFITALGDVFPCCFSDEFMGNIREQSLREIWSNQRFSNFRKQLIQGEFRSYCYKNRCSLPGVLHNW